MNGWAMYDWANSVYSLTITSAIFPAYYLDVAERMATDGKVSLFGWMVNYQALYPYALGTAFLIIALISPILSGIADASNAKKKFMQFFCYLGGISCAALAFFTEHPNTLGIGVIACMLAAIGWCGSLVFYNAYLPEIASSDKQDKLSAKGFALGYIGSVILLLLNLLPILQPAWFGNIGADNASRIAFVLVGVWWIGFAQITFRRLPKSAGFSRQNPQLLKKGYQELNTVWKAIKNRPTVKFYLFGFFFLSAGVQTIMYLASPFAKEVLGMETGALIMLVLIIQLVAIPGAFSFSLLSKKIGNLKALYCALPVWIIVGFLAYVVQEQSSFQVMAIAVGFVMGGTQALARSTFSKFIPTTDRTASYFSFYDVAEKVAMVVGMISFGLLTDLTNNMRNSVFAILAFFVITILFFAFIPKQKAHGR